MNKKEKTTEIRIVPCGERPVVNGESATIGEASECVNLREREQSLVPVGAPQTVAQLASGERLLTVDGDRLITLLGNELRCNGTAFATVASAVKGAVMTGDFLVLNTAEGIEYYVRTATDFSHLDINAAVPQLNLSTVANLDMSESFPEFSFDEQLTQWRVPLSQTDESALLSALQAIRFSLLTRAAGEGRYATPFLARYAVRLWDDSYLWVSQPVLLAADLVHANYRTASEATTSSNAFTGIVVCNVAMGTCRLGIEVLSGVQAQWKGLVKAIDVLVATDTHLVDVGRLDYRMGTTTYNGSRHYNIEFGFAPKSASEVVAHLLKSNWRVVASTTAIDALDLHRFVAPNLTNVGTGLLSGGVVAALSFELPSSHGFKCDYFGGLSSSLSRHMLSESIMSHNGRLHAGGGEWQSEVGWGVMPWIKSAAVGECEAVISVTMAHRG
ncbi:MAG: hypothetical protein IK092_05205, partial [Muribaculaceae bacterium]|nr:hypothetical protein [Muribaculaceae bacterium]